MAVIEADVVVVGSGPGGAGVARDLTLAGKKVHVVEMGPDIPPKGKPGGALGYTGGILGLLSLRKGLLLSRDWLTMIRGVSTGGSSMVYLGTAYDPDPDMWKPFGFDLKKEAEQRKKEIGVAPLPDKLLGEGAHIAANAARDLGYKWEKLNKFIDPQKCQEDCNLCIYGCHHGAKWHARDWVVDSVSKGATLHSSTLCEEIITEGDTAVGVRVKKGGKRLELRANTIVLAAGGVGSPYILQNSGLDDAGHSFFFDPFVMTCGVFERPLGHGVMMGAGMHLKDEGLMLTDMQFPRLVFAIEGVYSGKPLSGLRYRKTLPIMTKIRDDMAGTIDGSVRINKALTSNDQKKIETGKEIATNILRTAGAKSVWHTRVGAAHPGGTCGMGKIVDKNLETKLKNLYVCDASVIPVPFGIPPTLTCLALSKRLANHLLS